MSKPGKLIFSGILAIAAALITSAAVAQAPIPAAIKGDIRSIENSLKSIERKGQRMGVSERMAVIDALAGLMENIGQTMDSVAPAISGRDGWFQAVGEDCNNFCSAIGMFPGFSPEGAQCASGETVPASSLGSIDFQKGCWPNCAPRHESTAQSDGKYCYNAGQKRDRDKTDLTMGCYCGL